MRSRRLLASFTLLLAGCGGGSVASTSVTTTTQPPASTTTAAASTTAASTTTEPSFTVGSPGLYPPDPLPGSAGANGSGCPPLSGALPDGVWFGKLLDASVAAVRFNPGCFYFGDAAAAAAAADGIADLPSPHYLRDPLPDTADLPAALGAVAYSIDKHADPLGFLTFSLEEWPARSGGYTLCPGEGCAVWLYVNGGRVTEIVEQYLP